MGGLIKVSMVSTLTIMAIHIGTAIIHTGVVGVGASLVFGVDIMDKYIYLGALALFYGKLLIQKLIISTVIFLCWFEFLQ